LCGPGAGRVRLPATGDVIVGRATQDEVAEVATSSMPSRWQAGRNTVVPVATAAARADLEVRNLLVTVQPPVLTQITYRRPEPTRTPSTSPRLKIRHARCEISTESDVCSTRGARTPADTEAQVQVRSAMPTLVEEPTN
jgi:hypothetical protein